MSDNSEKTCEYCHFYMPAHAGSHGYCKRFAPVFTHLDDRGRPRFYNPTTSPSNWCGEWKEFEGED